MKVPHKFIARDRGQILITEVLPNGHIVFGNTHAGPDNPRLIEVTRDKKVVWTIK